MYDSHFAQTWYSSFLQLQSKSVMSFTLMLTDYCKSDVAETSLLKGTQFNLLYDLLNTKYGLTYSAETLYLPAMFYYSLSQEIA